MKYLLALIIFFTACDKNEQAYKNMYQEQIYATLSKQGYLMVWDEKTHTTYMVGVTDTTTCIIDTNFVASHDSIIPCDSTAVYIFCN
jgi:hypothetical protein